MAPSDPLEPLRRQQESIRRMVRPSMIELIQNQQTRIQQLQNQQAVVQQAQCALERQRRAIDVIDSPTMRLILGNQQRISLVFGQSPLLRLLREQPARWDALVTPSVVAQVESHQADLIVRVAEASESEQEEGGQAPAWFGAPSWSVPCGRSKVCSRRLKVLTSALTAGKMALDAPIPTAVIALLLMLCAAAEFSLWPSQAEGRGFETRRPLHTFVLQTLPPL